MAHNKKLVIPVICENSQCSNHNRLVNVVSEVKVENLDLFYEGYDGSDDVDYCLVCGELGVAEDSIIQT